MNIDQLDELVCEYIDEVTSFNIDIGLFNHIDGLKRFNKIIRDNIDPNRFGVYQWINNQTGEIVYVGMAGTINQKGEFKSHSIQNRLTASRGRDEIGKDIQTNKYVSMKMREFNIDELQIRVCYTKDNIPPTYVESVILFNYLRQNGCLPILNNAF